MPNRTQLASGDSLAIFSSPGEPLEDSQTVLFSEVKGLPLGYQDQD